MKNSQKGAVAVYTTLVMIMIITSGSILMSGILSKQISFSEDVETSERAFYSANSGVEQALYQIAGQLNTGEITPVTIDEQEIAYGNQTATYKAKAEIVISEDQTRSIPCVVSIGEFRNETRRIRLGPATGVCSE